MEYLIWGTLIFVSSMVFHYFYVIKKEVKGKQKNKKVEVEYLIKKHNIDMKKINYKKLMIQISFINTFIITLVFLLVLVIEMIVIKMIIALFLFLSLIFICYDILGNIYKKRGMTKDV